MSLSPQLSDAASESAAPTSQANYRAAMLALLVASVLVAGSMLGCSQQQASTSTSGSSSLSSAGYSANASKYEGFDSDVRFDLGVIPGQNELWAWTYEYDIKAASILFVFEDAYGDPLGTYDLQYNSANPSPSTKVKGLNTVANASAYIYSYALSDGETWGNRNATTDEILAYGQRVRVGINETATGNY